MIFDLCTIDWVAISSIVTSLMTIATAIAVFAAFRANRQAKIANKIAQKSLDELVLQREIQKQKDDVTEIRWKIEKRLEMKIFESTGENIADFYREEYPELWGTCNNE